jgi:hypothetical protein
MPPKTKSAYNAAEDPPQNGQRNRTRIIQEASLGLPYSSAKTLGKKGVTMFDEDYEYTNDMDESVEDELEEEEGVEDETAPESSDDTSDDYEDALECLSEDPEQSDRDEIAILRDMEEYGDVPEEHRRRKFVDKETGRTYSNEEALERMASAECEKEERQRLGKYIFEENCPLVYSRVKKCNYYGSGYSNEELAFVGKAKLVEAIEAFDREKYPKVHFFSTLACSKIDGGIRTLLERNPSVFKKLGTPARILKNFKDDYCKRFGQDPNEVPLEDLKKYAEQLVSEEYLKAQIDKEISEKESETGKPLTETEREKLAIKLAGDMAKQKKKEPDKYHSELESFAEERKKEIPGMEILKHPHIDVFCRSMKQLEEAEVSLNRSNVVSSMDDSVGEEGDEDTVLTDLMGTSDLTPEEIEREKDRTERIRDAIDRTRSLSKESKDLLKKFLSQEDPSQFLSDLSSGDKRILQKAIANDRLRKALVKKGLAL